MRLFLTMRQTSQLSCGKKEKDMQFPGSIYLLLYTRTPNMGKERKINKDSKKQKRAQTVRAIVRIP